MCYESTPMSVVPRLLPALVLLGCAEPPLPPWVAPTPEPDPRSAFFAPQMSVDARLDLGEFTVSAEWTVAYWEDIGDGLLSCEQRFSVTGGVERGEGVTGCADCSARLRFDEDSVQELTDPLAWPDDCDRIWLRDSGWDFGARPFVAGGSGELLDLMWMSPDDHARSGLDLSGQGLTADVLTQVAEEEGLAYGGVLLVEAVPGTIAEGIGLAEFVEGPEGAWRPWAWVVARDAQTAAGLLGPVSGVGLWIVQFQTNEG